MRPLDTTVEAERVQLEALKRMGPEGRLRAAIELSHTCRMLLTEGVRRRHPEYNEEQIRLKVISLLLPSELFSLAYAESQNIPP
jgi:hypothetical protein